MRTVLPLIVAVVLPPVSIAVADDKSEKAAEKTEKVVEIPDENLRGVILEIKHQKQRKGDQITRDDLGSIYFLDACGRDIQDLSGLEYCHNLGEARLSNNSIQDVSPLADCKNLQSLDVSHNQIAEVQALSALVKLQYLNIEHNQIKKLSGIAKLEALNSLYASHNNIKSAEPVAKLTNLWTLRLSHNCLQDIKPLAKLQRLSNLGLAHNAIEDVSPLPPGNGAYTTFLQGNEISDVSPLVELARNDVEGPKRFAPFWRLYLAKNPLDGKSAQEDLAQLKELGVRLDMEYDR